MVPKSSIKFGFSMMRRNSTREKHCSCKETETIINTVNLEEGCSKIPLQNWSFFFFFFFFCTSDFIVMDFSSECWKKKTEK